MFSGYYLPCKPTSHRSSSALSALRAVASASAEPCTSAYTTTSHTQPHTTMVESMHLVAMSNFARGLSFIYVRAVSAFSLSLALLSAQSLYFPSTHLIDLSFPLTLMTTVSSFRSLVVVPSGPKMDSTCACIERLISTPTHTQRERRGKKGESGVSEARERKADEAVGRAGGAGVGERGCHVSNGRRV